MKQLICTIIIFHVYFSTYAQKEIYFTNISKDSISISSMQGVELETDYSPNRFESINRFRFGYFNELKLGSNTSLIMSGDIYAMKQILEVYQTQDTVDEYGEQYNNQSYRYGLGIGVSLKLQPRWYFNYKSRILNGKEGKLNSGWYLSAPLELMSTALNSTFNKNLIFKTSLFMGYRWGLNDHLFLEAGAGVSTYPALLKYTFNLNPELNVKIAYKF